MRFLHSQLRFNMPMWRLAAALLIVGTLGGCGTSGPANPPAGQSVPPVSSLPPANLPPLTPPTPPARNVEPSMQAKPLLQSKSRWMPVSWADIPGFEADALNEAWNAWIRSCERPAPPWQSLCTDVRKLSIADPQQQRAWMRERLQPYRVEPLQGATDGLLTSYYEPVFEASRRATAKHAVALWQMPASLAQRKPWYTRKEIDTLPEAQAALRGREIAYLADPVDALILQIQGSGRLRITEPDGAQRLVRVAFAGTNDQPYRSVGRWLIDQGLIKDASWPGIKAWIAANPQRVQEMLWSNPRMVFFREEAIDPALASQGPRGAQSVPLTAGRSIAVDRESIPLGAPVWMQTSGAALNTQRMVIAQDVGSAILGAVRADYYAGSGDAAGELAGRLKQGLQLWVFWPK